ncbi:hypothetical protein [Terrisporobacter sp.]|uniref:hypothetical protein n=1 Tax=Terrisporobacter sp. TaxID=1965305 RepID=UPI002609B5F5|nr:hypothetical protein [Terrisporobacter sp.]
MNIWNKIDEPVMRAVSGIVYGIWGSVGLAIDYNEDKKELELTIWDKSYRCEDKKVVVNKRFNYEIKNTNTSTILDIVEVIEKFLIENYS